MNAANAALLILFRSVILSPLSADEGSPGISQTEMHSPGSLAHHVSFSGESQDRAIKEETSREILRPL